MCLNLLLYIPKAIQWLLFICLRFNLLEIPSFPSVFLKKTFFMIISNYITGARRSCSSFSIYVRKNKRHSVYRKKMSDFACSRTIKENCEIYYNYCSALKKATYHVQIFFAHKVEPLGFLRFRQLCCCVPALPPPLPQKKIQTLSALYFLSRSPSFPIFSRLLFIFASLLFLPFLPLLFLQTCPTLT